MNSFLYNHVPEGLVKIIYDDLSEKINKNYFYHNLIHTKRVIKYCIDIGKQKNLNDKEWKIILTACLFHDYGFIKTHENHEKIGANLCSETLNKYGYSDDDVNLIKSLILVTEPNTIPRNKLEYIIKDSDLEYFSSKDFPVISEALKKEWLYFNVVKNEKDFYRKQYNFLNNHKFYFLFINDKRKNYINENIKIAYKRMMKL